MKAPTDLRELKVGDRFYAVRFGRKSGSGEREPSTRPDSRHEFVVTARGTKYLEADSVTPRASGFGGPISIKLYRENGHTATGDFEPWRGFTDKRAFERFIAREAQLDEVIRRCHRVYFDQGDRLDDDELATLLTILRKATAK